MFTWNFQYVSKVKLVETLNQFLLNYQRGDILIRIHTSVHLEDEAVDLAKFIKNNVPSAHIFGTSTSATVYNGKLNPNQCIISVTLMSEAKVKTAMIPVCDIKTGESVTPDVLCAQVKNATITPKTKLLLTFLNDNYKDVYEFVEKSNDYFPGVQMIGGIANAPEVMLHKLHGNGFIFNEKGWSDKDIIVASISGDELETLTSYSSGVQAIGDEMEITDTFGNIVLTFEGKDAAKGYRKSIGDELKKRPEITNYFPFVYTDTTDIPVIVGYSNDKCVSDFIPKDSTDFKRFHDTHPNLDPDKKMELINANHNVLVGKKIKRAFIYDKKIVADNRSLFRRLEGFEKAETIFAYTCNGRAKMYSNSVKWELSAYENSNMCGCVTEGEITCANGKNTFANCTFVVSVLGEKEYVQIYNPYVFSHTDSLVSDNNELINFLMRNEELFDDKDGNEKSRASQLKEFIRGCELKLFYSETEGIPNEASMNMDIRYKGFDRICMIDITDSSGMRSVFSKQLIDLTYKEYLGVCERFAKERSYRLYLIDGWHIAIGTPSYRTSSEDFENSMKILQKELFENTREYIAIVPLFCLIDGCNTSNLDSAYYSARADMMKKNIQFYVCTPGSEQLDDESIREKYHMVNVINYAIAHDKVIPYYQGIFDNREKDISHFESLMRLEDEKGKIYYPGEFLEVARSFGLLYDSLSTIMIKKVLDRFKDEEKMSVSINMGMRDITNDDLVDYIFNFLSSVKNPQNFVFEILENEDISDYDMIISFVDKIHRLGAKISIDDFGSGYSNLQHLMSIHSDYIKIDGSIIKQCCESSESENLIALIAGLKNITTRDVRIVAEYVENDIIQSKMTRYNIDFSQGYLFSKPSPDIDLEKE